MHSSNFSQSLILNSSLVSGYVIPYREEFALLTKVICLVWIAIIVFGLTANIINIIVFLNAGANDSVTILLLSLAGSDLTFLILIPFSMVMFIPHVFQSYRAPFDLSLMFMPMYWPAFTVYEISAFISVSLGVMRCACVAMPLKFKFFFTKSRTIIWAMTLVVLAISLRIPVLSIYRIAWRVDPMTNASVSYVKEVNMAAMSRVNDIMNRGLIIYFNCFTMVSCVIILTFKLYEASRIRRACSGASSYQPSAKTENRGLSSKDLQVVQSVVLICIIFILSQLPSLITATLRFLKPDINSSWNTMFLFGIFSHVNRTCALLNASVNIFVYYNFNSKYKTVFNSLFCKSGQ